MSLASQEHLCALVAWIGHRVYFVGSCFYFLHRDSLFVATADHCVHPAYERYTVVAAGQMYEAELTHRDTPHDIAIFRPTTSPPVDPQLTLSTDRQVPGNLTLFAYEFSTTAVRDGKLDFTPATRMGNCVRIVQMDDTFGPAGVDMLELSFHALKGESGAAVVQLRGSAMIAHGMMVANAQRHLLPAQIETVLDERNEILEERRYFLPQAVAVNSCHIARIVEDNLV